MTAARTPTSPPSPGPPSPAARGTAAGRPPATAPGQGAADLGAADQGAAGERGPGLRERKKIKTRTAIREATYRLIEEQGYEATTVEQIAEAAEVSPSTVFRYFPTKEDIVLTDEFDPLPEAELRARPADEPLRDSLRAVMSPFWTTGANEEPDVLRLRTRLMLRVPAVRSRMTESMSVTGRMLCHVLADRTGRDADDLEVRVFAMGLLGALLEAALYWAEHDYREPLADLVDRTLVVFEKGLARAVDG